MYQSHGGHSQARQQVKLHLVYKDDTVSHEFKTNNVHSWSQVVVQPKNTTYQRLSPKTKNDAAMVFYPHI